MSHTKLIIYALYNNIIISLLQTALSLKEEEMTKSSSWLDLVFSLLILNKAKKTQLESTLQPEFIDKLLSAGGKHLVRVWSYLVFEIVNVLVRFLVLRILQYNYLHFDRLLLSTTI